MIILILHTSGEQLMNRYERVRQTRKGNFKRRWNCFVNEDIAVLVFEVMFTREENIIIFTRKLFYCSMLWIVRND